MGNNDMLSEACLLWDVWQPEKTGTEDVGSLPCLKSYSSSKSFSKIIFHYHRIAKSH